MDSNTLAVSSTNNLGDVQLVSSSATIVDNNNSISSNLISNGNTISSNLVKKNNNTTNNTNTNTISSTSSNSAIVENDNNKNISQNISNTSATSSATATPSVSTSSNSESNNSFSALKMERDEMYSKSLETYQKIVDSEDIPSDQKSIAIQEIQKITELQNSIKVSEELIKLKGFDDVVIYSSNGQISVIVRVAVLSNSQVAQIQNIISKELGAEISNITISNK